jgi:type II secretory pathway pseudopilin PulG
MRKLKLQKNKGLSLVEVLVGTSLMLIVFMGIFGAYQLGLKTVGQSQRKVIATSVANQQIEMMKNLPYESVGVMGGFPDGVLEAATSTIRNGIAFTIEKRVDYVVDPTDGVSPPSDECPNDYKRAEIKVSWSGKFSGQVNLYIDISPKDLAKECATGGGILSISIFDAYGIMVPSPLIEVKDPATNQTLKSATPIDGQHYFSLASSTYKVIVSKDGYSQDRTYGVDEVATPEKAHFTIFEDQLIETSFSIDKTSSFSIDTFSPWGTDNFSDSFLDESKISEKSDLFVSNGEIILATSSEGYLLLGYLISTVILPGNMKGWDEFSFTDEESADTDLKYQLYYASGTDWNFIPDEDLPGNSIGLDSSPVDLSGLSTTTYSQLKLRANFSSSATSSTPILYDWQTSWITNEAVAIPGAEFNLLGEKFIGKDDEENKVYKYSIATTTDSSGHKSISGLEWDFYNFSINPSTGLDLINSPQRISLSPDATVPVILYLDAQNSFLLTLQDADTLAPIFSGTVRMHNTGLGYDNTQHTNEKGQTYFIPLDNATYNLEIEAPGRLATTTTISVSGDVIEIIKLDPEE